jgi:hypothetical protein
MALRGFRTISVAALASAAIWTLTTGQVSAFTFASPSLEQPFASSQIDKVWWRGGWRGGGWRGGGWGWRGAGWRGPGWGWRGGGWGGGPGAFVGGYYGPGYGYGPGYYGWGPSLCGRSYCD